MSRILIKRLASAVPVLLLVSLIAFVLIWLVPGDAAAELAGPSASPEELAHIRADLGLDQPVWMQALHWYRNLLSGDLGQSLLLNRSVATAILERLPITLSLTGFALVLTLLLGVGSGTVAALKRNSWIDQAVMTSALVGLSLPDFWLGLVAIYVFSVALGWFPTGGFVPFTDSPMGWLHTTTLPAAALAITQVGLLARMTRSSLLEVLSQDYIRTAWAKGLPGRIVILKHALLNIGVPVLTVLGISIGILFSGAVVIESVFAIPGVGRLIIDAVLRRDLPVIQGGILIVGLFMVLVNIAVDLLYGVFDPRVAHER
ncbi:ABC di/oligopeptide transporter inner membrane subunit [Aliidongia dinghuensis]|uniref:ABC di/oligopeptide transporter inner membrane subunit n=1 Tax=Aliidongia dinghuensis TaxID=1867774 RepID=A0A8J2YYT1_9PROT|nr:ABC transporter permease [Aliidongia dinghuensis]GGF37585.1 ABC di/oligopeptide transporter inner membrane subunit [Aliidongia dinghuensis]